MNSFPYAEKISAIKNPLDWTEEKSQLMVAACREMALFHKKNSKEIAHLYQRHNFDPDSLQNESDIARIPALGVSAMKYFLITSEPPEKAILKLTSSGTRGQKTQIWFDEASLARVQKMMDVYLEQEGMVSAEPTNYLIFNYDPDDAGDLGIAYTEKNQLRFAPAHEVFYSIKKDAKGKWISHTEKALEILTRYAADAKPVRVFGMPAFIFEFLHLLQERNLRLKLPKGSLMLTGGGWKAAEDKKITREDFRSLCTEYFGIPNQWLRDAYGMAEHCAPYFECKEHKFHIAAYNRMLIRDPETLSLLPNGEVGLMELITPFNSMMPTLAIMTTDYGSIDKESCRCGQKSPTFSLVGRAGLVKHKGCAITASDIVKR